MRPPRAWRAYLSTASESLTSAAARSSSDNAEPSSTGSANSDADRPQSAAFLISAMAARARSLKPDRVTQSCPASAPA